jgi:hypothetical protein
MTPLDESGASGQAQICAIVPAFATRGCIARCVDALRAAGFGDREIIVVDDCSPDGTADIVPQTGVRLISHGERRGAAAARNTGALATASEVLFFVDADVLVHPDARRVILDFFATRPGYDAVFGTYDDDPEHPSAVSRARNLLHRYVHLRNAGDVASFWTGCGAVRRRAYDAVGGFDPDDRMMEDIAFGLRLSASGYLVRLLPDLQGKHLKAWTLLSIARSDLFDRAVPWARLLRARRGELSAARSLNIDAGTRISVALVALGCLAFASVPLVPAAGALVALGALVSVAVVNRDFLVYFAGRAGRSGIPAALAVLVVHFFCGGLGFAWVWSGLDRVVGPLRRGG